jgi:hypothetical protein
MKIPSLELPSYRTGQARSGVPRLARRAYGALEMREAIITFACLTASYFLVLVPILGHFGQALVTAILASIVFSVTLLVANIFSRGRAWRAFWIANIALTLFFGGWEIYAGLTLKPGDVVTRFGGELLWINGHITAAGVASTALDIGICVLSNLLGFSVARLLIARLD